MALPAGTRNTTLTLKSTVTANVVAACKARGMSVTATVYEGVAGANYALADTALRGGHHTSTIRFAPHRIYHCRAQLSGLQLAYIPRVG